MKNTQLHAIGTAALLSAMQAFAEVTFVDQTAALGQGTFRNNYGTAAWCDYNNDGYPDLLDSHYFYTNRLAMSLTYRNGFMGNGVWGDYNNDGFADLYVWENRGYLYRNNGGVSFSLQEMPNSIDNRARGVSGCDFDRDGDLDLYVSCYRLRPNQLLRNNGAGAFTDVAAAFGVAGDGTTQYDRGHTIGSAWGDLDNDGYIDLFVANFSHADLSQDRPKFMRNLGPAGSFHFQLKDTIDGADWQESYASAAFGDYDNDGDLDLLFTTVYDGDHTRLWRNDGNWIFTDVTDAAGLGDLVDSYAAAWADFDNDGDLDLTSDARIFINQGTGKNWLRVKLEANGVTVNRPAIGAQVRIDMGGGVIQTRQVEGGTGKGSQNEWTLHFGMGTRTAPVALEILWPGGETQLVPDVALNQTVAVTQPQQMVVDPEILTPFAVRGADAPAQQFAVSNTFKNPMNFTVSDDAGWLSVSPVAGICSNGLPTEIQVNYSCGSLTTGVYTATITVAGAGATNSPQAVAVTLTVGPHPEDLPVTDSFEAYAPGLSLGGFNGWAGYAGAGVVTSLSYLAQTPPGYPLPSENHTQALNVSDLMDHGVRGADGLGVNLDLMVLASRSVDLPVVQDDTQFAFAVNSNGALHVWHLCQTASGWTQGWTDLGMPPVPEDQWVRLSVTVDYATSPLDDTFFRPRVNGSLCPSAQAFKAPDDLTAGGTWYMCANSPGRGGGGTKRISGVALEGRGLFDDLSVQTSTAFAHTGATSTNGVPFTWFDQWGVARSPEIDNDGDGFDAAGEYAAGTDPTDAESLFRIIDCWSENGRFYLRFTGNDSGSPAPFAVERSTNALSSGWTTVDPSVPRAVAPETVNVWSEEMSPVLSPAFYRVKVLDNTSIP